MPGLATIDGNELRSGGSFQPTHHCRRRQAKRIRQYVQRQSPRLEVREHDGSIEVFVAEKSPTEPA